MLIAILTSFLREEIDVGKRIDETAVLVDATSYRSGRLSLMLAQTFQKESDRKRLIPHSL